MVSLLEGKTRGVCSVQLCAKYRQGSAYIESLPSMPKDKRSCFSQDERSKGQSSFCLVMMKSRAGHWKQGQTVILQDEGGPDERVWYRDYGMRVWYRDYGMRSGTKLWSHFIATRAHKNGRLE